MAEIPAATPEFVDECVKEYELTFHQGSQKDLSAAKLRLVWALAHSTESRHNTRAVHVADEMLSQSQAPDDVTTREVQYIKAVALYKLQRYVKCRQQCSEIIKDQPESRQAVSLKDAAEEALIKEGIIGVGVGLTTGLLGVAVALAFASRR